MDVRYAPGRGILLARAGRFLLVGVAPDTVPGLVDRLWAVLERPDATEAALATVRRHAPGTGLAYLDAATGRHLTEPPGTVERVGDSWRLGAGALEAGSARLPLVEGVAAAAVLEVTGPVPPGGSAAAAAGTVIEGIPAEILASTLEDVPDASTDTHPDTDPDHDHRTQRRDAPATGSIPPGPSGHLEQTTSDTVLAVRCPTGHLTDPLAPACRTCGSPVTAQEPQRVLRPPLGVLRLPGDEQVVLDRPVVLGRRPGASGPGDWPRLVQLPVESTYLSRNHVRIDLDGWHVVARDLGSRGGTTLFAPGRDPERIRGHQAHLLEHGTVVDLAGAYQVLFLTAPPTTETTT